MRPRLYTLIERVQLRALAAKLVRQHPNPMRAAEQLAQEKQIPLHDAIAFVAIAKQAKKRNTEVGSRNKPSWTLIFPTKRPQPNS